MIAFLTQYLYGLGHSNRVKILAENTSKYEDVVIINQLFKPPLEYTVPSVSFLEGYEVPQGKNPASFIRNENLQNFRYAKFLKTLDKYKVNISK